jgi:hypothetical protein
VRLDEIRHVHRNEKSGLLAKGSKKLLSSYAGLFENPAKRTRLDLAMVRNDATRRAAPKNDMATTLTNHDKTEMLQCTNRL